jgi:hypothetical protein
MEPRDCNRDVTRPATTRLQEHRWCALDLACQFRGTGVLLLTKRHTTGRLRWARPAQPSPAARQPWRGVRDHPRRGPLQCGARSSRPHGPSGGGNHRRARLCQPLSLRAGLPAMERHEPHGVAILGNRKTGSFPAARSHGPTQAFASEALKLPDFGAVIWSPETATRRHGGLASRFGCPCRRIESGPTTAPTFADGSAGDRSGARRRGKKPSDRSNRASRRSGPSARSISPAGRSPSRTGDHEPAA